MYKRYVDMCCGLIQTRDSLIERANRSEQALALSDAPRISGWRAALAARWRLELSSWTKPVTDEEWERYFWIPRCLEKIRGA